MFRAFTAFAAALSFFAFAQLAVGEDAVEIQPGRTYLLKVPTGQSHWALEENPNDARWCYTSFNQPENKSYLSECHLNEYPQYRDGTLARVSDVDGGCALVSVASGQGWVDVDLVEMTPEMQTAYEARKAAEAKRDEQARVKLRKRERKHN